MAVKSNRIFQQTAQALDMFVLGFPLGGMRFQGDAGFLGQLFQRLGKVTPFLLHDKFKDIPAFIALAKAAPGARFGKDCKSGGVCIGMERAKAGITAP